MRRYFLAVFCFLIYVSNIPVFAQEEQDGFKSEVSDLFLLQRYYFPQEKVYLHFDRDHYVAGDTVWFRGHLVDAATHRPDTSSRYLYADLLAPTDSVVQRLMIRREGMAYPGYFALPDDMPEGNYTVWAYTMHMRNVGEDYFFRVPLRISEPLSAKIEMDVAFSSEPGSKRLSAEVRFRDMILGELVLPDVLKAGINRFGERVWKPDKSDSYSLAFRGVDPSRRNVLAVDYDKSRRYAEVPPSPEEFDVTFHPEGGYLVAGTTCIIGFKALNAYGMSEDVRVEVFDSRDNSLISRNSFYRGMGYLNLFPVFGESYYAVCTNSRGISKRFDLPEVYGDRAGLRVVRRNERLMVSFFQPEKLLVGDTLYLVGHTRGDVFFAGPVDEECKFLVFDSGMLPSGVNHFLLLDRNRNILCERLVFIRNDDQARVRFSTDKPDYGYRMPVRSKVRLTDSGGKPLSGNFSVSVTDDKDILPDTARNIYTELLLASDLKGYIESPAWYFEEDTPARAEALDALMLTQGWRRYELPDLFRGKFMPQSYPKEKSMAVSGRVKALLSSRPSVNTPVYFFIPTAGHMQEVETDKEGRFSIGGFEMPDSSAYFIQALNRKGKQHVELLLDEEISPPVLSGIPGPVVAPPVPQAFIAKADQKWIIENGMRTIHLESVEVRGSRRAQGVQNIYDGLADKVFDSEFIDKHHITNFEMILRRVPGIRIDGDAISIRGATPLFVIDDIIQIDDFNWKTDIDVFDVERVEFIVGAMASIFGIRGNGAVILIYTKIGTGKPVEREVYNRKVVQPLGYQRPAEFYAPGYETQQQKNNRKPDLRTTIYWNPSVSTGENGTASFEFYTADGGSTTYSVVIEGVTDDGKVIRSVEKIGRGR